MHPLVQVNKGTSLPPAPQHRRPRVRHAPLCKLPAHHTARKTPPLARTARRPLPARGSKAAMALERLKPLRVRERGGEPEQLRRAQIEMDAPSLEAQHLLRQRRLVQAARGQLGGKGERRKAAATRIRAERDRRVQRHAARSEALLERADARARHELWRSWQARRVEAIGAQGAHEHFTVRQRATWLPWLLAAASASAAAAAWLQRGHVLRVDPQRVERELESVGRVRVRVVLEPNESSSDE